MNDHAQISLAGEYYILAQLTQRGFVATLTLSATKGVDILASNPSLNRLYKVEVKTTVKKPGRNSLFGDKPFYVWPMSAKHESMIDPKLIYCFVHLHSPDALPKIFVVPSKNVARYVKWQHQHYLATRKKPVADSKMRVFRIAIDDPDKWENNWKAFR